MQISSIGKKVEQPKSKAKKYVLIGLIISAILLFVLLILLVLLQTMKPAPALTLNVDGEEKQFNADTFKFTNDSKIYISLKDVASLIGYRYYDGEYKKYTQNKDACYLESDDEVVVFELNSDKIYKTLNNGQVEYSEFKIASPIIKDENGKFYIISTGLMKGCNLYLSHDAKKNVISISTLPGVFKTYSEKIKNGEYKDVDGSKVEGISENFNNKKTILYGMLVVSSNIKNETKYGVISLDGSKAYLGIMYNSIDFLESSQAFLVSVKENNGEIKYGVKNKDNNDKIITKYDKIKLLDGENQLYYVELNGKKGVVNSEGDIKIYAENDQIGVNTNTFSNDNIKNPMLLYSKYIPVQKNGYWALYGTDGKQISDYNIEILGYINNEKSSSGNILLIEDIEGIVAKRNGKYGIITTEAIEDGTSGIFEVKEAFDGIYSETVNGKTSYYLVSADQGEEEVYSYVERMRNTKTRQANAKTQPTSSPEPQTVPRATSNETTPEPTQQDQQENNQIDDTTNNTNNTNDNTTNNDDDDILNITTNTGDNTQNFSFDD